MQTTTGATAMWASAVMNGEVRDAQGQDVGRIEDYVIDMRSGCAEYAMLASGGKVYVIPWSKLTRDESHQSFVLNVGRDQLQAAPSFDRTNWASTITDNHVRAAYSYWGMDQTSG